jgi:glycosyltransferase involved in cell wall biosynthesis
MKNMNVQQSSPLITVAIPNYNTGAYIAEAIESALSQTFKDFELLVIDNASNDNSREIIRQWEYSDSRIRYKPFEEHVTAIENWNRCLTHARGTYIVFLHADDKLKPLFLEDCLKIFELNPELGYVFAEKEIINSTGQILSKDQFYEDSAVIPGLSEARINLIGWHTVSVQMLIRAECMRAIGGFHYTDVMAILLLNLRWDVGYIHRPLVQYRHHQKSATSQFIKDKTMFMTIYLTKMIIMNYHLPPEGAHLRELKDKVMEKAAYTCLTVYAMDVLGRNEHRLCREYLALARSFWLDVDQTPLYRFLEDALKAKEWTPEALQEAWAKVRPPSASSGPPYPLPEGSVVIPVSV